MLYDFIDLLCIRGTFICKHEEMVRDIKPYHNEINYEIPAGIIQMFGDANVASRSCVVLTSGPFRSLSDGDVSWFCHSDPKTILDFQEAITKLVKNAVSDYQAPVDLVQNNNLRVPGTLIISDKLNFKDLQGKDVLNLPYESLDYSFSLKFKEEVTWTGDLNSKPATERCFKVNDIASTPNVPYVFCVYYKRTDFERTNELIPDEGNLMADLYSKKINQRVQKTKLNQLLALMKKNPNNLTDKDLKPLTFEINDCYNLKKHLIVEHTRLKLLDTNLVDAALKASQAECAKDACSSDPKCINIAATADKYGLLAKEGGASKFAGSKDNPYLNLMPPVAINIPEPSNGVGQKIVDELQKIIAGDSGAKLVLPESNSGEVPNRTALIKTLNSLAALRQNKQYNDVSELVQNCKLNMKNNSNNLKRKVGMLQFAGDNDPFLAYLGNIYKIQANPPK